MATMHCMCVYRGLSRHARWGFSLHRLFHTSQRLEHDPNLKKKKKSAMDLAKEKMRKEKQAAKRRAEPILIPVDPDSVPGIFVVNFFLECMHMTNQECQL